MDYQLLESLLDEITTTLQQLSLWQSQPPSAEALASQAPFAVDHLAAHEWLQWIFLPKMRHLIAEQANLPAAFAIAPYFEQALQEPAQREALLPLLRLLDRYAQILAN